MNTNFTLKSLGFEAPSTEEFSSIMPGNYQFSSETVSARGSTELAGGEGEPWKIEDGFDAKYLFEEVLESLISDDINILSLGISEGKMFFEYEIDGEGITIYMSSYLSDY